jgi:triosephosphate isomerase
LGQEKQLLGTSTEMHEFIRETVRKAFGSDIAESVSILYGGSVKPDNAKEIFSKP